MSLKLTDEKGTKLVSDKEFMQAIEKKDPEEIKKLVKSKKVDRRLKENRG